MLGLGQRGVTGIADDVVEVNVGYADQSGLDTVLSESSKVVREFQFDVVTVHLPNGVAKWLADQPDIRYVEKNTTKRLHATESQQLQPESQMLPDGIERINAAAAHENGSTGTGVSIAIIDTGIDSSHPDLEANLGSGTSFVESDDEDNEETEKSALDQAATSPAWDDRHGHGTHCAGIAAAVDNSQGVVGVAPESILHAIKVGSAAGIDSSDVAAGIEYVGDQGYDVANLSLGSDEPSAVIKDACVYAYEKNVLLVASAGNIDEGENNSIVRYPAAYDEVIAVGATTGDGELAEFSLTGPEVEIAAPGVDIYSTVPGGEYVEASGTSMAAPYVTGAGALLMANEYSNVTARERLRETATDIGLDEEEVGSGLLDVSDALTSASKKKEGLAVSTDTVTEIAPGTAN